MTLPICERVRAGLTWDEKRAIADIRETWDDKGEVEISSSYLTGMRMENARLAALYSALVQAVRVMENNSCGKEYYERNRRLGLPLGPTEEAYEQTAAIEKVLGEK